MNPDREPRVPNTESVREGFGLRPGVRKYEDGPVPLHVLPYRPQPRRDLWKRIDRLCELRVSRCRPGHLTLRERSFSTGTLSISHSLPPPTRNSAMLSGEPTVADSPMTWTFPFT